MAAWLACATFALPAMALPPSAAKGVSLLPSGVSAIRFAVDVPQPLLVPISPDHPELTRVALDGYVSEGAAGSAALPERVVTVALPATGRVSLRVSSGSREVRDDVRLGRVPLVQRASGMRATAEDQDAEAIARAQAIADDAALHDAPAPDLGLTATPGVRARLLQVGWMRNQRIARVAIAPAEFDIASRRLTIDRHIEIEVDVAGAETPAIGARPAEDPDPFEEVYRAALLNYEQGRAWRRTKSSSGRMRMPSFGAMSAASTVPDTSVYAGRNWIKIAVDSAGFYKVDFGELRNLPLFNNDVTIRLDQLRLFTWPGFPVMPENGYCDACGYQEVAMGFVESNNNGLFDQNSEYFYFYALGPSDWEDRYDPALPDTVFINHPYEKRNYYYLAIDTPDLPVGGAPKRIATETSQDVSTGTTPPTFTERIHFEEDNGASNYWPNAWPNGLNVFWEKWYWATLGAGGSPFVDNQLDAPGVDVSQPSRFRMRAWGVTDLTAKSPGVRDHYLNVGFDGLPFHRGWENMSPVTFDTTVTGLVQPQNALTMSVPIVVDPNPTYAAQRVDQTALAWIDLYYQRRFEPIGNALNFGSAGGATPRYDIGPFTLDPTQRPRVFDVTDALAPIEILGGNYAGAPNDYRLQFKRDEASRRRYSVIPDDRIVRVANADIGMAPSSSLFNLRAAPEPGKDGADYLIIYYDGFQTAAESLATWRQYRLPLHGNPGPYETSIVPISALYDQFSGGRTDPGAIRNFLRSAFFNWAHPPVFVTLLGDASVDFKNIQGLAPQGLPGTLLPSYENGYVPQLQRQFATDDWMLNVDDSLTVIPDFFGGRIPAADAAGALAFVREKLLPYERTAPYGEWRNKVLLVADDNMQGAQPDGLEWEHVRQTAVLDDIMPNHLDRVYAYLHTYPDGPNFTKPACKADILKAVNDGVVMWNYIGHGSPFKISDESVFIDSDAGTLTNATRPCVFVAASCDVGKFDDPAVQSLGERLVMSTGGGCVAVISATELAFSYENSELNQIIYNRIFTRDSVQASPSVGQYYITMADALLAAKINSFGSTNNQKYQVMGDAATRLNLPRFWVELTMKDENGAPVDTLRRGSTVTFTGRLLDAPGGALVPFDGTTAVLIEDSAPIDTTFACPFCNREPYPYRAAPIFRGDARVAGGTFAGHFVVPLDAVLGPRARLRGYASGSAATIASSTDGAGSQPFTLVSGTAPAGDDQGPNIALSFAGGSTSVRPDAVLRVDLTDASGILITGHTVQNGIIVTVDENSNTRADITSSFRYAANSYQTGTASFRLPGLAPGPHSIKVSAADNLASGINAAQHRSSASIEFSVSEVPALEVKRAFLFPNPTHSGGAGSGGQFVIDAPGDAVNVLLNLYTVSGRLIRTLKAFGGLGQIQIPWDGLDRDGARLASGTYLFHVQVNARDELGASDPRSRAVGEGRFVVLGR